MAFAHMLWPGVDAGHRLESSHAVTPISAAPTCRVFRRFHAAGAGHDANSLLFQLHHQRHFIAVHIRRLGGDVDFQTFADAACPARLGLDVACSTKPVSECGFGDGGATCKRRRGISFFTPPSRSKFGLSACKRRARRGRSFDAHHRWQRRIADRQFVGQH